MRIFQTFSAVLSTFLSSFGLFSAVTPIRRAEIGDRTVLRVIIAAWCPRIAGAAVHTERVARIGVISYRGLRPLRTF